MQRPPMRPINLWRPSSLQNSSLNIETKENEIMAPTQPLAEVFGHILLAAQGQPL